MSPENAALISAVVVAAITAGPAYIEARRSRRAAHDEGEATREAIVSELSRSDALQTARLNALSEDIASLRDWQTSHTAEHIALRADSE